MTRLDAIVVGTPGTAHYTSPISPLNPRDYPYRLLALDDRAETVLTPEEWASRLTDIPVQFLRP